NESTHRPRAYARCISELFRHARARSGRSARYQNEEKRFPTLKPKPRRNRRNTIPKANRTIPAVTPTIPVTLITRPIKISLSAIADLLAPAYQGPGGLEVDDPLDNAGRLHQQVTHLFTPHGWHYDPFAVASTLSG